MPQGMVWGLFSDWTAQVKPAGPHGGAVERRRVKSFQAPGHGGSLTRRFRPPPGSCPLVGPRGWRGRCPARGWKVAGRKRPYSARGRWDFGRTQGASKPAVPAGQLPCGARVVMPPGPCVPFPGAGGTFPPARRPAARSPSEAAVATRTPSGASVRTIGTVGIKCQERIAEGVSHRCWRTGPHPALTRHLLPQAGEGSCTNHPSPMRSVGEGARRAGEGPSDSEGVSHRCCRTGPHLAFGHLLPQAGEGWCDRIRSWPARGWGRRCRRGPWARRR